MEAASGYVILAFQEPEQRAQMIDAWTRETGRRVPRDLEMHLDRIRKAGYEKRASYLVKGIVNISCPILDDRGSAMGALTIPYIQQCQSSVSMNDVIAGVRKAAIEITAAIGGSPETIDLARLVSSF